MGQSQSINNNIKRDDPRFASNNTIFGKILRGELPADVLSEDEDTLCFRDISPVSEFHALIIPKRYIEHCGSMTLRDGPLLQDMELVALAAVQQQYPDLDVHEARENGTLALGYHRWPFITVKHLHLHAIYPMPAPWHFPITRTLAFPMGYGWFFPSSTTVIASL